MTHHIDLSTIVLESGSHDPGSGHGCLLEWVSIFAGVDFGDAPECTSPVLGAFGRSLNDAMADDDRQALRDLIPRLVGTAGDPDADVVRAWMATDWLVRTYLPAWLRLAGLTDQADRVTALAEISAAKGWRGAEATIRAVGKDAAAARAAAWDAAAVAAWDAAAAAAAAAARAAAWDAARAAAWDAAWDAAAVAAWDAARAAAWDAARDAAAVAAWDAARAAARAAAWDAARAAAWDAAAAAAWDAAAAAARDALRPTVVQLQLSAVDLFGRMADYRTPVAA